MNKTKVFFLVFLSAILPLKAQIYTPSAVIQGASADNNIGIGTTTPAGKLHINNAGVSGQLDYNLIVQKSDVADNNRSATGVLFSTECCGPFGKSAIVHERTGGYGIGNLHFLNNNIIDASNPTLLDAKMTINWNGNIGIGTINPTEKLTVAGKIKSREVQVTVDAGADFVFDKDYNLPSLESVDQFIKKNKHLPEIASAQEMEIDGINLSEMNIKLLQKIEEMTLYMIEMKKENERIREENQEMKKDILIIKSKV